MATEHQIQAECFQWHWNTYPLERQMLYHNNNNSVNQIAGNKMKAIGVVAGISDFTLVVDDAVWFIEMKAEHGKQKPEQVAFQCKVVARGHFYVIIKSPEKFKELIRKIYGR